MTQKLPSAIILAGGLGTRLRGTVPGLPKPLAPIAGRPFLCWLLERLGSQGVHHVVLATGYRSDQIQALLGQRYGDIRLEYSEESSPLGTGGAIRQALSAVRTHEALVLNGDTFADVDLAGMHAAHRAARARITIATVHVPDASRYGTVRVEDGLIREFLAAGRAGDGTISAGVYCLAADILDDLPCEPFSFERDLLQARLSEIKPLAYAAGSRFIDIGTPDDFHRAQSFFGA